MLSFEHPARAALALASVPADVQNEIIRTLYSRLDREQALARRDYWLRTAHDLLGAAPGDVLLLAAAVARYQAATWPMVKHLAAPRAEDRPLQKAFFMVCQAAEDAGAPVPGYRQLRRLVT